MENASTVGKKKEKKKGKRCRFRKINKNKVDGQLNTIKKGIEFLILRSWKKEDESSHYICENIFGQ